MNENFKQNDIRTIGRDDMDDLIDVVFSYLDEAIEDLENGYVYSEEEVFAELACD